MAGLLEAPEQLYAFFGSPSKLMWHITSIAFSLCQSGTLISHFSPAMVNTIYDNIRSSTRGSSHLFQS